MKKERFFKKFTLLASALVFALTLYMLVLPAVMMDSESSPTESAAMEEFAETQKTESEAVIDETEVLPSEESTGETESAPAQEETTAAESQKTEGPEETAPSEEPFEAQDESEDSETEEVEVLEKALPETEPEVLRDAPTMSLTVNVRWSDDWNSHNPVTLRLMRTDENGNSYAVGREITVGEGDGGQAVFDGLEYIDGEFPYFAEEVSADGYIVQYGEIVPTAEDPEWDGLSYKTTVKNTRIYPSAGIIDPDPQLNKMIDYLGDGETNPDTDLTGEDFYRLYLDVTGSHQPVDLLIIADFSQSMTTNFGGGMSRKEALDRIVNGTILSGSGAGATRDTDGIIYNFLHLHPDNNVAVTCFGGGWNEVNRDTYERTKDRFNPITMPWTNLSGMPNSGETARDCYASVTTDQWFLGTNYTSALLRAEEMLTDPSIANNDHIKVMIFLTDGEPNRIIDENGVIRAENGDHTYTENRFVEFVAAHPNMVPYIVGISPEANSGAAYNTLSNIASRAHATYYPANDASYLQNVLRAIIDRSKFSLVQITDELSPYVEYYSEQPDLKITRTDASGNETVVWDSSGSTADNYDEMGNRIIQSVTYTPSEDDSGTGRVNVKFNPECLLDGENTFVLSFNVKLTEYAKDQYIQNGYNETGDEGTDYGANVTSSTQVGFYSNNDAYITFTAYDIGHKTYYDHPVVQHHGKLHRLPDTGGSGINGYVQYGPLFLTASLALLFLAFSGKRKPKGFEKRTVREDKGIFLEGKEKS
ncbi:MAG: hypothetical protein IKS28_06115 [Clostridia bacterium]|nr:hypothetical protein [Clostridia bacterium]